MRASLMWLGRKAVVQLTLTEVPLILVVEVAIQVASPLPLKPPTRMMSAIAVAVSKRGAAPERKTGWRGEDEGSSDENEGSSDEDESCSGESKDFLDEEDDCLDDPGPMIAELIID